MHDPTSDGTAADAVAADEAVAPAPRAATIESTRLCVKGLPKHCDDRKLARTLRRGWVAR